LYSESIDLGGNFICSLKLLDGTEVKGYGKSKKLAKQNASKKVKK
jgi:dsRNA-specific ribonuclease